MKTHPVYPMLFLGLISACGHQSSVPQSAASTSIDFRQDKDSQGESEAIRKTALDYIEGWYEGDTVRMDRSLHPDLVKRVVENNQLQLMTKADLMASTRHTRVEGKSSKVTIFDVYENIAIVKVDSTDYMDYLQLGKVKGKWVIVNVLWVPKR
jgi:hypothetical protein